MATLPADNYVNQDARTVAEMKTALESMRDVTAEASAATPQEQTISAGALSTAPNAPLMKIKSEGWNATPQVTDTLQTLAATDIDEGRIVILTNALTATTAAVTVQHDASGSANTIRTANGASFVLQGTAKLAIQKQGTSWVEVWRSYGDQTSTERTDLGLGDAATRTINSLSDNAGMIGKVPIFGASVANSAPLTINSDGEIIAGTADGGNAATLDNLDSTEFVRNTPVSQASQTVAGSVVVDTDAASRVTVNSDAGASTTGINLTSSNVLRAAMTMSTDTGLLDLMTQAANGTRDASIRLNQSNHRAEFYDQSDSTWKSVSPGVGNGLDADQVHGVSGSLLHNVRDMTFGSSGGSFKINDGTNTFLIQWASTADEFSTVGEGTSQNPYVSTWTFPTSYPNSGTVGTSVHYIAGRGLAWKTVNNYPFEMTKVQPVVYLDKVVFNWPTDRQNIAVFTMPIVIGKVSS
tara:strand:+ start:1063 stop:2463 length:1401 start_codon:yes stop_codon:yes gene_type:complete